jgi:serine phosphatase RsbU (regulator of sigma subunit)
MNCCLEADGTAASFETERLVAVVQRQAGGSAKLLPQAILDAVAAFVGDVPSSVDVTVLVVAHEPSREDGIGSAPSER